MENPQTREEIVTKGRLKAVQDAMALYIAKAEGDPGRAMVYLDDRQKLLEGELWTLDIVKKMLAKAYEEIEDGQ